MRYAIMSDVHANPKALEVALADARRLGCGKFILLGDVTGYGYDPKGALEGVRRTTRYQNIEVEYFDAGWQKRRQKYSGWTAQIIQHEIDHLEGIII